MKPLDKALLEMQALRNPRMAASVMGKTPAPDPYYGHPSQVEPGLEAVSPEDFVPNPKSVVAALKALGPAAMLGMVGKKTPRKMTEFEQRHMTAQKNAALPVEQGGLGLSPNNTAMDRAKAMGMVDAYHATSTDIPQFDVSKSSPSAAFGKGVYTADDPTKVSGWAKSNDGANVMPLMVDKSKVLPMKEMDSITAQKLSSYLGREIAPGSPVPYFSLERRGGSVSDGAAKAGFSGVDHAGPGGHGMNTVFSDPSAIRSRFAAFDPMRRHEADLLGRVDPQLLKYLAAGSAGAVTAPVVIDALRNREGDK